MSPIRNSIVCVVPVLFVKLPMVASRRSGFGGPGECDTAVAPSRCQLNVGLDIKLSGTLQLPGPVGMHGNGVKVAPISVEYSNRTLARATGAASRATAVAALAIRSLVSMHLSPA